MPLPYSTDLRERVLLAYEHGEGTAAALARRFRVALNTVKNWVRALEREGRRSGKCCASWWRPTTMPPWPNMARDCRRRPGSASASRCSRSPSSAWACPEKKDPPGERAGARGHHRRTRRLCRSRPEHRARGPGLSRRDRGQHQADAALCAGTARPARLRHRARPLAPRHGARSPGAQRLGLCHDRARCDRLAGVSGFSATGGDPSTAAAQAGRHSRHGSRLRQARPLLESAGFALLPLPRYSPDLSPIEHGWSKFKTPLRTAEPRSIAAIEEQIGPALDTITPEDAQGWFRHCGYAVSN
jgi:transposase-like protein